MTGDEPTKREIEDEDDSSVADDAGVEPADESEAWVEGAVDETVIPETGVAVPVAAGQVGKPAGWLQSVRNLWIVIGGLTLLLLVSMLVGKGPQQGSAKVDEPELAAMRADLEARRSELNRQRAELNLPPLATQGEDVDEISRRLRKDTETLISLMERYRRAAEEKNQMVTEKNLALIRSEQIRESLTTELGRAQANSVGNARSEVELSNAVARANRLADELAMAREMIEELSAPQENGEVATLKQRLEEANRARDFFEQRVQVLERQLSAPKELDFSEGE